MSRRILRAGQALEQLMMMIIISGTVEQRRMEIVRIRAPHLSPKTTVQKSLGEVISVERPQPGSQLCGSGERSPTSDHLIRPYIHFRHHVGCMCPDLLGRRMITAVCDIRGMMRPIRRFKV